jgi:hypothetical protein
LIKNFNEDFFTQVRITSSPPHKQIMKWYVVNSVVEEPKGHMSQLRAQVIASLSHTLSAAELEKL